MCSRLKIIVSVHSVWLSSATVFAAAVSGVNVLGQTLFRFLHLTDLGREIAEKIYERHRFFMEWLMAIGVDEKTAEIDACRIEHVISEVSFRKLKEAYERGGVGTEHL